MTGEWGIAFESFISHIYTLTVPGLNLLIHKDLLVDLIVPLLKVHL